MPHQNKKVKQTPAAIRSHFELAILINMTSLVCRAMPVVHWVCVCLCDS